MSNLSNKLHGLRIEHKMTQKDLATRLLLTPKMISFYERDERTPSREVLIKLSEIFNVSIDYLLDKSMDERLPQTKAVQSHGFYYDNAKRERVKQALLMAEFEKIGIDEYTALCEDDLKQYFSRSLQLSDFSQEHPSFKHFAAMLLNSPQFKARYRKAYDPLTKKYPPTTGIPTGVTFFDTTKKSQTGNLASESEPISQIARMLSKMPKDDVLLCENYIKSMFDREND